MCAGEGQRDGAAIEENAQRGRLGTAARGLEGHAENCWLRMLQGLTHFLDGGRTVIVYVGLHQV